MLVLVSESAVFSFRIRAWCFRILVSNPRCLASESALGASFRIRGFSFRILVSESASTSVSESAVLVSESAVLVSESTVFVSESTLLVSESQFPNPRPP